MKRLITKTGPSGLQIVFDPKDHETPCMVYLKDKKASATFECAFNEGEVEGYPLTQDQMNFLSLNKQFADEFYDEFRVV